LAVVDDPTAKQRTVQGKAGAYAGTKKYGDAANLPVSAMKKKGVQSALKASRGGAPSSPSPRPSRGRDERSSLLEGRGEGQSTGGASATSKVHNLTSTKCTARSPCPSAPVAPNHASPNSLVAPKSSSRPTPANPVRPEFGPAPRSSGGAPGASRRVEEAVGALPTPGARKLGVAIANP
jgi:excinuclease ABC subunit B